MRLLIDVSNVQGRVDWAQVVRSPLGVRLAYAKASEGLTFQDGEHERNRAEAARHGVAFGSYHFARPDLHPYGAEEEAKNFLAVVRKLRITELRPVLDFEVGSRQLTPAQHVNWAQRFNRAVHEALGIWPAFYSYSAFIAGLRASRPIGAGLWVANYGANDGREHALSVPPPWRKAVAHQFTSKGRISGVPGYVDMSSVPSPGALYAHRVKRVVYAPITRIRRLREN